MINRDLVTSRRLIKLKYIYLKNLLIYLDYGFRDKTRNQKHFNPLNRLMKIRQKPKNNGISGKIKGKVQ